MSLVADDEGVVRRERMAGIYRLSAYFLAVMTTEIPVVIVITTMFVTVFLLDGGTDAGCGQLSRTLARCSPVRFRLSGNFRDVQK